MSDKDYVYTLTPFGYESISVAGTATGFTAATRINSRNEAATRALVTVETAQIRYRVDGTDPTSSEGHLLYVGDILILTGDEIRTFSAIRVSSSATIKCTYYN